MKNTILISLLLLATSIISAQQVDIEGDTKIVGKIDIISTVGDSSVFIGANAGINDDGGNDNTFVGGNAGKSNATGGDNSFFGRDAGASNTMGSNNSFFGHKAGLSNTSGGQNAFFGERSGINNKTGGANSFFGYQAGFSTTTGEENSFFGHGAGESNIGGDFNSFFGRFAGQQRLSNMRSTLLGYGAETGSSLDRAIAIGHEALVTCSNCAVIGGTGDDAVKVGITNPNPQAKLHILDGVDASLTNHGYIVNGDINGENLVIDDNEIIARNDGAGTHLYLNAGSGNVAIGGTSVPSAKLHVTGRVRISDIPNGSGSIVVVDSNGNLRKSSTSFLKSKDQKAQLSDQAHILRLGENENNIERLRLMYDTQTKKQNERIKELENTIEELKEMYQQLLTVKNNE